MAVGGKGNLERVRRGLRTAFFMLTMVASLLVSSAPVLVAVGDVTVSLVLASRFTCARCYSVRDHLERYGFKSSLMDIPLVSIVRSLVITCIVLLFLLPCIDLFLFPLSSFHFFPSFTFFSVQFLLADSSMICSEICNSSVAENEFGNFDMASQFYLFMFVFCYREQEMTSSFQSSKRNHLCLL